MRKKKKKGRISENHGTTTKYVTTIMGEGEEKKEQKQYLKK